MTEAPGLDLPCPHCQLPVGDHTLRGYGDCLDATGKNLHMPYIEFPDDPIRFEGVDAIPAGGLNVKAGTMDTALGKLPMVLLSFELAGADPGRPLHSPDYMLILDAPGLQAAKELLVKNINAALRAVRETS